MDSSVNHPVFSRLYLWTEGVLEAAVGEARRAQNVQASGRTLIVGAGTGLDVPALNREVTDVWLLEPDPTMRRALRARHPEAGILDCPAEAIAASDASFDTVLSTLVLCSVRDLDAALREVARVLKPDGQFLFLEHVRNPSPMGGIAQRAVEPAWKRVGGGCHLTRDVVPALQRSPLEVISVEAVRSGLLLPIIRGRAVRRG